MYKKRQDTSANILWKKTVARDLLLADPANAQLLSLADSTGAPITFGRILYDAVKSRKVSVTDQLNDDSMIMVDESILQQLILDDTDHKSVIGKYEIVENWLFDREAGEMKVHIMWIGPIGRTPLVKNDTALNCMETWNRPLFWLNYDELARSLASYTTTGPHKRDRMTCQELFTSRNFASKIICVSDPWGMENQDKKRH